MKNLTRYFFKTTKTFLASAIMVFLALAASGPVLHAADISITSPLTTTQTFTSDSQTMAISGSGNIAVSSGAGISETSNIDLRLTINNASGGVSSSSGSNGAIELTGTSQLRSITLSNGTITSNNLNNGTIILNDINHDYGAAIFTSSGTTISNTATSGKAIEYTSSYAQTFRISNSGTISASNNSNSTAIYLNNTTYLASTSITNNSSGIITAGASGNAIDINSTYSNSITNYGTIAGSIVLNDSDYNSLTILNYGTINSENIGHSKYNSQIFNYAGTITTNNDITASLYASGGTITVPNLSLGYTGQATIRSDSIFNGTINATSVGIAYGNVQITKDVADTTFAFRNDIGNINRVYIVQVDAAKAETTTNNISISTNLFFLSSGATFTAGSGAINVSNVFIVSDTSTLNINSGVIHGDIIDNNHQGTVNFHQDYTLGGNVGRENYYTNLVTVADGKTVNTGSYCLYATTISLGIGSHIGLGSCQVQGTIQSSTSGGGSLSFTDNFTARSGSDVGSSGNKIGSIAVSDGVSVNMGNNNLYADVITVGSGSTLTIGTGTISNNIQGSSDGVGSVALNGNRTLNVDLGTPSNSLANVNVVGGTINTGTADIDATNTNVSSGATLSLGSGNITGNVTAGNGSTVNAGGSSHDITGDLTTSSGSTVNLNIVDATTSGLINTSGSATVNSNTHFNITVTYGGSIGGLTYTIISGGAGSSYSAVSDSNINVNGSGSNVSGGNTFTITHSGNNLVLNITSGSGGDTGGGDGDTGGGDTPDPTPTRDHIRNDNAVGGVYRVVSGIPSPTGTLKQIQDYINSGGASDSQVVQALKSVNPQVDNGMNKNAFYVSNASVDTSKTRLNNLRIGVASGDSAINSNIWIQQFGSIIHQGATIKSDGYNAVSLGTEIGVDHEISENDRLGMSVSYANANLKSENNVQSIGVSTYQINLYEGHNFEKHFVNTILGFAWNEYSSSRIIPAAGTAAKAKYNGQTYIAKIEAGMANNLKYGFQITPLFSVTGTQNRVQDYTESGADTLNLSVQNKDGKFLEGRIGIEIAHNGVISKGKMRPALTASYGHDFVGDKQVANSKFIGQSSTFESQSASLPRGSLKLGSSMNFYGNDRITLGAGYEFEHRSSYSSHTGFLKARYSF